MIGPSEQAPGPEAPAPTLPAAPPAGPTEPTPVEKLALCVIGFWEFFQAFIVMQGIDLPLKSFHKDICDLLEEAFLGLLPEEIQWIIINMPPRTGKTKILEAWFCWGAGYFHDSQWIYTCYAASLVERSLDYIGKVMRSAWYVSIFGDFVHSASKELVNTTAGGNMHGEGTGGALTGKGGGLKRPAGGAIAIDDPSKPEEALSKLEAEKLKRWTHTTIERRRNSDRWCPMVLCMQRLGPDDLVEYVKTTYPKNFRLLKFPALVNEESTIPETVSTATLLALRNTRYGRFTLASQYQQEPIALGGNLIQTESFRRYKPADVVGWIWDQLIITCDTALKIKEENDYSCMQLWGKKNNCAYLLDEAHGKWESPMLLATAIAFSNKVRAAYPFSPMRFVVEEKAAGTGLIQQMNVARVPAEGIERDTDKVRRVQAVLPFQEAGMVFVPFDDTTPFGSAFLTECAQFKADMTHSHDDRVDCFADGVSLLLGRGLSILEVLGRIPKRQ